MHTFLSLSLDCSERYISDAHTTFGTVVNVTQNQKPYMKNIKNKIYFKNFVKSDPHGDANPIINFISP